MAVRVRITSMPLIFLLLCSALLATTLQGVQGEVEVEGPSESECRPYIEKALKKLETGDTQSAEIQDDDIIHTVTTDDSETQSGEAIESIISKSIEEEGIGTEEQATEEVEIDTAKEDGDSEQTGDTQEESAENKASTGEETDQTDIASEEKESGTEEAVESSEKDISLEAEQISAEKEETAEQKSAEQEETAKSQEGSEEVEQASSTEQEETQTSTEEAAASAEQESVSGTEQETTSVEEGTVSSEQQDEAPASTEQEVAASIEQEAAISTEQETAAEQEATISVEQETTSSAEQEASISAEQEATTSAEQEAATSAEQEAAVESTEQEVAISAEQEQEGVASVEESATSVEQAEDASSVEEATISVEQETAASTEDSVASTEQETTASLEQKGTTSSEDVAASTEQEGTTESVEDNAASTEQNDEAASLEEHVEISEEKSKDEASVEQREDVETNAASAEQTEAVSSEQTETTSVEQTEEAASVEKEAESVENKAENVEKEAENIEKEKVSAEVESTEGESADAEQTEKISEKVEAESTPEEDLTWEVEIPAELRSREHINEILNLNDEPSGSNNLIQKAADKTLNELKRIYENAIKPLETLYKYRDLSNRHFGDPEIFSKPLVLFMGPWSGGKSSIINYLLDNEYTQTALRTGAEPSPAYFNLVMWGEEPEVLDGTQLAADWTFSGLQKFGQGLEERLRGLKLPNKLLEKINIVEIPGILEVRKQVSRVFPFNDACQWFIDRADIIFLIYDPSKLDVGPETEAILDQLKGREYQTRIILNKADQVKPEELMRVQGALIWNISPLMSSAQPPVMYSTSLWSRPYEIGAPARLLYAQERAFLKDLKTAVDKRIENKIASARRFAVRVRNHAKMVDCYLTTYYNHKSVFGNKKLVSDQIIEHPQDYHIYEGLSTLTNISRYDLPDPDVYRDFFRLNPLYDFQQLSATCTYFRGCPINRLDVAIAYDLPELVGKYKKMVETATNNNADSSTKS